MLMIALAELTSSADFFLAITSAYRAELPEAQKQVYLVLPPLQLLHHSRREH